MRRPWLIAFWALVVAVPIALMGASISEKEREINRLNAEKAALVVALGAADHSSELCRAKHSIGWPPELVLREGQLVSVVIGGVVYTIAETEELGFKVSSRIGNLGFLTWEMRDDLGVVASAQPRDLPNKWAPWLFPRGYSTR